MSGAIRMFHPSAKPTRKAEIDFPSAASTKLVISDQHARPDVGSHQVWRRDSGGPLQRPADRKRAMSVVCKALRWFCLIALTIGSAEASAMDVKVTGDQLILSGPVVNGDLFKIENALTTSSAITTVILRDSPGGDIATGYQGGELFRRMGLRTAVSGYCYSSCSRLFLGGKTRIFTDDKPPERTHVGFHGHYDDAGHLARDKVERFGLVAWIIEYSDGKADPDLVKRWAMIPENRGLIHFFHPSLLNGRPASTFFCAAPPPPGKTLFDCEPIARTALELGVITSLDTISSNDAQRSEPP